LQELKALTVLVFMAPDLRNLVLGDEETRALLGQLKQLFFGSQHVVALAAIPATEQTKLLLPPFLNELFPGWEKQGNQ